MSRGVQLGLGLFLGVLLGLAAARLLPPPEAPAPVAPEWQTHFSQLAKRVAPAQRESTSHHRLV